MLVVQRFKQAGGRAATVNSVARARVLVGTQFVRRFCHSFLFLFIVKILRQKTKCERATNRQRAAVARKIGACIMFSLS